MLRVVGVSYLFLCMYLFDGGGVGGSEGRSGSSLSGCVVFSLALALNVFFFSFLFSFFFFPGVLFRRHASCIRKLCSCRYRVGYLFIELSCPGFGCCAHVCRRCGNTFVLVYLVSLVGLPGRGNTRQGWYLHTEGVFDRVNAPGVPGYFSKYARNSLVLVGVGVHTL